MSRWFCDRCEHRNRRGINESVGRGLREEVARAGRAGNGDHFGTERMEEGTDIICGAGGADSRAGQTARFPAGRLSCIGVTDASALWLAKSGGGAIPAEATLSATGRAEPVLRIRSASLLISCQRQGGGEFLRPILHRGRVLRRPRA